MIIKAIFFQSKKKNANFELKNLNYLDVVVAVVVEVEDTEEFGIGRDVDVVGVEETLAEQLSTVLFHLDVVELSVKKKRRLIINRS